MRRRRGLTLVEIMVLVAILGILAAIVLPSLVRAGEVAGAGSQRFGGRQEGDGAAGSFVLIGLSLVSLVVVLNLQRSGALARARPKRRPKRRARAK